MDRICPFLALATDHRTAVDGYDPDHACHALNPAEPIDRARQAEQCLSAEHRQCDRYLAYLATHAADSPDIPTPSAEALIPRTRLVVDPEARRMAGMSQAAMGMSPRRWLVAGGVALVGVAAAATAVAGGFGSAADRQPQSSSQPTASPSATTAPSPSIAAEPTTEPSTPAQTTYVVQQGDTLNAIAVQFGTTAAAIRQANGLPNDVINIGQVLIIP